MGMLYYTCSDCKDSIGVQAQYIGNVICLKCQYKIEGKSKGVPRMETHIVKCEGCQANFSFEGMHYCTTACIKCNKVMKKE